MTGAQKGVLSQSLKAAVPLWVHKLRTMSHRALAERAHECGATVASTGDALQFSGESRRSKAATASAFNALAEGLAIIYLLTGEAIWLRRDLFDLNPEEDDA